MIITPTTTRGLFQLAEFSQWVVWRREPSKDGKLTKVPYNPHKQNKKASSTNPKTWGSYEQARAAMVGGCYDGIGFSLWPAFVQLVGIDIDHCIDEQGNLSELARQIVTLLDSYTEISPSGTGIRIFLFGDLPEGRRKHTQLGVEMYTRGRFLTVTGNHLPGSPEAINHRTEQAAQLHRQIFGEQKTRRQPQVSSQVDNLDDQALIEMIRNSKQGAKFERLWSGAWQPEYPSQSEADLALAGILYWWSGGDEEQTKRLFAQSGLYRAKWDRADYQALIFNELSKGGVRSPFTILSCKADSKVFTLKPYRLSAEAMARKERILAESKLKREEKARQKAYLEAFQKSPEGAAARQNKAKNDKAMGQADYPIAFIADEVPDPEEVRKARASYSSAKRWKEYVTQRWPDLDPDIQLKKKLEENRAEKIADCGKWRKRLTASGKYEPYKVTCNMCEACLAQEVRNLRRAINERLGIHSEEALEARLQKERFEELREELSDLISKRLDMDRFEVNLEGLSEETRSKIAEFEELALAGIPGDPLPKVTDNLSMLRVYSEKERKSLRRKLKREGILFRVQPVTIGNPEEGYTAAFDFLIATDRLVFKGKELELDPALPLLSDGRLRLWAVGAREFSASGELLPSAKVLERKYREPDPCEIIEPEMEWINDPAGRTYTDTKKNGEEVERPVRVKALADDDDTYLSLPDLGTDRELDAIMVDFEVRSQESLQAALLAIHQEQIDRLTKRGFVTFGVSKYKKFFTPKVTMYLLLRRFNYRNEAIKAKLSTG